MMMKLTWLAVAAAGLVVSGGLYAHWRVYSGTSVFLGSVLWYSLPYISGVPLRFFFWCRGGEPPSLGQ